MSRHIFVSLHVLLFLFLYIAGAHAKESSTVPLSEQTQSCLGCHRIYTPGIVEDWYSSRHSKTLLKTALQKPALARRVSVDNPPDDLTEYAVGCYECHSQNPEKHEDNFQHMGYKINVVVSPNDCKTCHPIEANQFSDSKKAYAIKILLENPVFSTLTSTITGIKNADNNKIISQPPSEQTLHETCLGCHGTKVKVKGMKKVYTGTKMGVITVPDLTNWPNQGVGRENPDGSLGSCAACHSRHSFSIEIARKPYTCAQCHLEPDVPAWNVYKESKHGNIFSSKYLEWDFKSVPWTAGKDFKAPTCATCHNSLIVSPDGDVVAERTHDFGARLWVRIFGLIYTHPQPKSGDTTIIKNKDGLPLPTTFNGEPASEYLIDKSEQEKRLNVFVKVCNTCHSTQWINGHFEKLENTIRETDKMTLTATKLITDAWGNGIENKANPFDESIEKMWVKQWLFYTNSIRYASAMTGAPDYASFKLGWWEMTRNLEEMKDFVNLKSRTNK
ncbi:MAG: hydroxylamine oxidase [Nitrospirae bacterium RBG_13_39_12]|nr:MAG: hydroxylamine oxidase [Nitrospirae bacterium RBG_13_39_12]